MILLQLLGLAAGITGSEVLMGIFLGAMVVWLVSDW